MWKYLTPLIGLLSFGQAFAHSSHHLRPPSVNHHQHQQRVHVSPPVKVVEDIKRDTLIEPVLYSDPHKRLQTLCMALGIYQEARGLPSKDRFAVGHAILNQMKKTGDGVCETLWENHGGRFQWTKRPVHSLIPREITAWKEIQHVAWSLLTYRLPDTIHGATMFYNPKLVHPAWAHVGVVTARMGHVFVKPRS